MEENDLYEDILQLGLDKGRLTYDEIDEVIPPEFTAHKDYESFIYLVQDAGIKLEDKIEPDLKNKEYTGDGLLEDIESNNIVRTYLQSMGNINILTKDETIEIAKKIKEGNRILKKSISGFPVYKRMKNENRKNGVHNCNGNENNNEPEILNKCIEVLKSLLKQNKTKDIIAETGINLEKFKEKYEKIIEIQKFIDNAKNEFVIRNLRLVVNIAKQYVGRGLPLLDLIQEGNMGLMKAVERFDYRKGFKFSTYAVWWIRQAILRALIEQTRTVRLPVHVIETYNKLNQSEKEIINSLGRKPDTAEIADNTGVSLEKVENIYNALQDTISINEPIGDDKTSLEEYICDTNNLSPYESTEQKKMSEYLLKILHTLTPKEEIVIKMRFGIGCDKDYTLEEIGKHLSITRERVRQIEEKAIKKLRHPKRLKALREMLH
ncbi:MAG: sigma-70 family RNA polymerase sigma factor [Nitrospirae bacterium]|jgi:RNA polymerase primary sigma factor|nr:sigma-70 family RNA polymerase sigma factor [Nitrospirota bacterium]